MDLEEYFEFKAYLKRKKEHVIRRFSVKKKFSNNFQYLVNKIRHTFPELGFKSFQVMWNDSEDMIHISSNEELILALSEMKLPLKKIYIKCVRTINNSDGSESQQLFIQNSLKASQKKVKRDKQKSSQKIEQERESVILETQTKTTSSSLQDVLNKYECFEYMDCVGKLNDNIEQIRLHLINPDGTISENYNETKLQALQLSAKKLQCIVDKLQDTRSAENIVDSILFQDTNTVKKPNITDVIQLSERILSKNQITNTNEALPNGNMNVETVDTMGNVQQNDLTNMNVHDENNDVNDFHTTDNYGCEMIDDNFGNGSSVKTLSEVSSDEENDRWTLLDSENQMELESLPDLTSKLEALKDTNQDKSHVREPITDLVNEITVLSVNSTLPTIHNEVPPMVTTVPVETQAIIPAVETNVISTVETNLTSSVETNLTSALDTAPTPVPQNVTAQQSNLSTRGNQVENVYNIIEETKKMTVEDAPGTSTAKKMDAEDTSSTSTSLVKEDVRSHDQGQWSQPEAPHLAAGLEILYSMGFNNETKNLLSLLEAFDGNVELVLDTILFTDL